MDGKIEVDEVVPLAIDVWLGEIGINFAEHCERAIAIGETIGAFRD